MAALSKTDSGLAKKVASALIGMQSTTIAAEKAKVVGWNKPLDYGPVKQCLKKIKYGIFGI